MPSPAAVEPAKDRGGQKTSPPGRRIEAASSPAATGPAGPNCDASMTRTATEGRRRWDTTGPDTRRLLTLFAQVRSRFRW